MPKSTVIDVILLTVRLPTGTPDRTARAALRTLETRRFMARLRRTLRALVAGVPELASASVTVAR